MGKKEFEKILDQRHKASESIDWEKRKNEWIDSVYRLYNFVDACLDSYKKAGKVQVKREQKTITEEFIGTYYIKKSVIEIGDDTIVIEPIGTLIIGSFGRVDVRSNLGMATLVLVPETLTRPRIEVSVFTTEEERNNAKDKRKAEQNVWKIATEPPSISYLELTEDRFFDIMVELLGATF